MKYIYCCTLAILYSLISEKKNTGYSLIEIDLEDKVIYMLILLPTFILETGLLPVSIIVTIISKCVKGEQDE